MEPISGHFNVENVRDCSFSFFLQAFGSFLSCSTVRGLQQAVWQSSGEVKQEKS